MKMQRFMNIIFMLTMVTADEITDVCGSLYTSNGNITTMYLRNKADVLFARNSSCTCSVQTANFKAELKISSRFTHTCARNLTIFDSTGTLIRNWSCEDNVCNLMVNDTYILMNNSKLDTECLFRLTASEKTSMFVKCSPDATRFSTNNARQTLKKDEIVRKKIAVIRLYEKIYFKKEMNKIKKKVKKRMKKKTKETIYKKIRRQKRLSKEVMERNNFTKKIRIMVKQKMKKKTKRNMSKQRRRQKRLSKARLKRMISLEKTFDRRHSVTQHNTTRPLSSTIHSTAAVTNDSDYKLELVLGATAFFFVSAVLVIRFCLKRQRRQGRHSKEAYRNSITNLPFEIRTRSADIKATDDEGEDICKSRLLSIESEEDKYRNVPTQCNLAEKSIKPLDIPAVKQEFLNMDIEFHENKSELGITTCKERIVQDIPEMKVQIVKPLKTFEGQPSDDVSNQEESNNGAYSSEKGPTRHDIDWNSVFRYLIKMLPANRWKLFFNFLYGYGESLNVFPIGMTVDGKISQIEIDVDVKLNGVEMLFFELFKEWRELFGEHADASYIEKALREIGYNDVLGKFQSMMRNPPIKTPQSQQLLAIASPVRSLKQVNVSSLFSPVQGSSTPFCYAVHDQETTQRVGSFNNSFNMQHNESNYAIRVVNTVTNCQNNSSDAQAISSEFLDRPALTEKGSTTIGQKRRRVSTSSESEMDGPAPIKYRKCENIPSSLKRKSSYRMSHRDKKYSRQSRALVSSNDFNERSYLDLMMRYLPLGGPLLYEKEYHLFLDHTVSVIMKKTQKSEKDVLSMLCTDYGEVQEYKSKRHGYIHYIIETDSTCFTLEQKDWECLKLFAEHARKRVVERLTSTGSFVDSKYLFIRFDGTALLEQLQEAEADGHPLSTATFNNNGAVSIMLPTAESSEISLSRDREGPMRKETDNNSTCTSRLNESQDELNGGNH